MSKNEKRRAKLFNRYLANFNLVRPLLDIRPNVDDVIYCPLCLQVMSSDAVSNLENQITLEHVPSQKLGGTNAQTILLCKRCNNNFSAKMDASIQSHLEMLDFVAGVPGSSARGHIALGKNPRITATYHYKDAGQLHVFLNEALTNPTGYQHNIQYIESKVDVITDAGVSGTVHIQGSNIHLTEVAKLKYAYQIFFQWFGYIGILQKNLRLVREQIFNPESDIIQRAWGVTRGTALNLPNSIYIICAPKELQGFLVVFDLNTGQKIYKQAVLLPKLYPYDSSFYDRLYSLENVEFELVSIQKQDDFWTDLQKCEHYLYQLFPLN